MLYLSHSKYSDINPDMIYRELGDTGLNVSVLSFGASSLGGVFHDFEESKGLEAVYTAIEMGINLIDVSPYYGFTKAETVLGKALQNIDRSKYFLSTKVGRYGTDIEKTWDYSGHRAIESIHESMERLNVDYIDLISVHDVEFADASQVINETLPALWELKEAGIVGHVGITGLPLPILKQITAEAGEGMIDTVLNFCHYSLNDDALTDDIEFYKSNGVGIINASPLGMGLLSERKTPIWHPASEEIKTACRNAANHCKSKGYRIEQLAIKYAVDHPDIATTLVSTTNRNNIRKNVEWALAPQNEELLAEVLDILAPVHRETWENS